MSPPCSQDWKFFVFRIMNDMKKINGKVNIGSEKVSQSVDILVNKMKEKTMDPQDFVTKQFFSQFASKTQQEIDQLKKELADQRRLNKTQADTIHQLKEAQGLAHQRRLQDENLVDTVHQLSRALKEELADQRRRHENLVDTVHQLKGAQEEDRHTSVKQDVRIDQIKAVVDVDHATMFEVVSDVAILRLGGTSELSRVETKIATKAGREEVEQQLKALRAEGIQNTVLGAARPNNGRGSPEYLVPTVRDAAGPLPHRSRMPLKRKVGYDFKTTHERRGGRFLDY